MTTRQISVPVARHAVGSPGDVLMTVGLGSCIAIIVNDPVARVGGMAHILLPDPSATLGAVNPYKFASSAVPQLVDDVCAAGAVSRRLDARLVGGASMFAAIMTALSMNIGERNLVAAREALELARIPIAGEDVGGDWGRTVWFDIATGKTRISSVYRPDVHL